MPVSPMNGVIKHLRRAALLQDGAGQTDGQLLAWFIRDRDGAAFEALVRRHGPMVMSVCRRLLRNHHDAEDAFQATFLVLARKAASIAPPDMLAKWLHGVAYHTALKAKARSAKRAVRERQVMIMPDPAAPPQDHWYELRPLLDRELTHLPEKYRVPIILCDLEGKSIKEAARHLGWPQGTLAGRLARARTLFAKRLARHGLMLSGGALATVLSASTASACVPTFLVSSTVKAATLFAVGKAAAVELISVKVAALTEGVVMAMLLSKLKTVTMVLVVLIMVVFGGGLAVTHATAKAQPSGESVASHWPSQPVPVAAPNSPIKTGLTQFVFDAKLVEVERDGHPRIMAAPCLLTLENQVAQLVISKNVASVFPNTADACNDMEIGTRVAIKAKRVDAGKAQIDLTLSTCKVEKAEKADTLIVGNSVRAVKEVDMGKRTRIVLSHDHQGNPQLWFELAVSEGDIQQGSISPPHTLRTAPKKQNPENTGASWPFIY